MDFVTAVDILDVNPSDVNDIHKVNLAYQQRMRKSYTSTQQITTKQAFDCLVHHLHQYTTKRIPGGIPESIKDMSNNMPNIPISVPLSPSKLSLLTRIFHPGIHRKNICAHINSQFGTLLSHFCSLSIWYVTDAPNNVRREYISLLKICSGIGYPAYVHDSYLNITSGDNLILLKVCVDQLHALDWNIVNDSKLPLATINLHFAKISLDVIISYLCNLIPNLITS